MKTGGVGQLRGGNILDHQGLIEIGRVRISGDGEVKAEKKDGEEQVDSGSGEGDERALIACFGEKFIGSAGGFGVGGGIDIGDVLSCHADVAAERNGGEAPVCVAALDAEKTRAKADREDIDADFADARGDVVSPFMDEDDETEGQDTEKRVHAIDRLRLISVAKVGIRDWMRGKR